MTIGNMSSSGIIPSSLMPICLCNSFLLVYNSYNPILRFVGRIIYKINILSDLVLSSFPNSIILRESKIPPWKCQKITHWKTQNWRKWISNNREYIAIELATSAPKIDFESFNHFWAKKTSLLSFDRKICLQFAYLNTKINYADTRKLWTNIFIV